MAFTCENKIKYRNVYSDNLHVVLCGVKEGNFDSISFSYCEKINDERFFNFPENKSLSNYDSLVIINVKDHSCWLNFKILDEIIILDSTRVSPDAPRCAMRESLDSRN